MSLSFTERIEHFIEAGYQALYIPTPERSRCEEELGRIAEKLKMKFICFDGVNGFVGTTKETTNLEIKDPLEALMSLDADSQNGNLWKNKGDIMFVMRNLHVFLEDPAVRQCFQNLYYGRKLNNLDYKHPIIIVSNVLQLNPEIATCVTVTSFGLPTEEQLAEVFDDLAADVKPDPTREGAVITYTPELRENIITAMRGLTSTEAENTLAFSLRVNRGFSANIVGTLEDAKARMLEKSEVLTYIPKERIASMDEIGGYDELKEFIAVRKLAYTKKAKDLGVDLPKGILLCGIPGTGKSMVGKVIAKELGLPLVMLDVASVFRSLVGESEKRITTALAVVDNVDGSVMLIDEVEKALGNANESVGDSGVSKRVFGVLLTWLTERKSRTFVVMTANKTVNFPAEFMRAGRFDKIFFTDIPTEEERAEILRIHCKKRGIDMAEYKKKDVDRLLSLTENFVGAEIEQVVIDARYAAFADRQSGMPTIDDLNMAATKIIPLSVAERENLENIKKLCEGRATNVSKTNKATTQAKARSRTLTV